MNTFMRPVLYSEVISPLCPLVSGPWNLCGNGDTCPVPRRDLSCDDGKFGNIWGFRSCEFSKWVWHRAVLQIDNDVSCEISTSNFIFQVTSQDGGRRHFRNVVCSCHKPELNFLRVEYTIKLNLSISKTRRCIEIVEDKLHSFLLPWH